MAERNIKCDFCDRIFSKYGIKNHINIVHNGKIEFVQHFVKRNSNIEPWNKGLTIDTDERIKSYSKKISDTLKGKPGRKHTDETKDKISKARIKYLEEHPDQVPYLLNHSSVESYPEKYFQSILEKTKINYERYYQISIYQLDFAFVEIGVDLEIDGEQHYSNADVMKSNKKRDIFLTKNGWKVIRIKWGDFKRLKDFEKIEYVNKLLSHINCEINIPKLLKK
jgi:very-short-patch-repair endonuclease